MDYFNELLNSYNQLKKRTFKLKFINEEEKPKPYQPDDKQIVQAVGEIQAAVQAAFGGQTQEGLGNKGNITIEALGVDQSGNPKAKITGSNLGWGYTFNPATFNNVNWTRKKSFDEL